ncbi:MAG TPA: hypothetical protein VK053_00260 [Jiangellaceae bacterium]|nr:hypothetical protein [Jiangellaceae bacterium]
MAISHISNGNKTFGVRNDIERGTWDAASFTAMLLAGHDRAEIDVRVHGHHAKFTKNQLQTIAKNLLELTAEMPDTKTDRR